MKENDRKDYPLYYSVRTLSPLLRAWQKVRSNGLRSSSKKTKTLITEYAEDADKRLRKIARDLLKNSFEFDDARGFPIDRENKKHRPLVIATIKNRIVQRSLLETLSQQASIQKYFDNRYSFGGIRGKGVEDALELLHKSIREGANYFARSDIKDFFTKIDRQTVLKTIGENCRDSKFMSLLELAAKTELENMAELKELAELFPIHEEGMAQGCSLSPLFGNIQLHEFDLAINGMGVTCIRYIDDFVIVGPDKKTVAKAFEAAKMILNSANMEIYDPFEANSKGQEGNIRDGVEFLGCVIKDNRISPSGEAIDRIKQKIIVNFKTSADSLSEIGKTKEFLETRSISKTLNFTSNLLKGWGNQYFFCNNRNLMASIDTWVMAETEKYLSFSLSKRSNLSTPLRQRMLGIQLLTDCKSDPIVERTEA